MSRSYSIRIPIEVLIPKGTGLSEGSFSMVFTMLEILSPERMKELLTRQLLEKGYNQSENGLAMPLKSGKSAVLDPDTMTMQLKVPMPESCAVYVQEEYLKQFKENLKQAMETGKVMAVPGVENKIEQMKQDAAYQLKQLAVEARKDVNLALKEVYREAIREKAASIGNVENVSETKEGNTYRIRIEISA
ncbi:MAG: hypothetical protein PWR01_3209 [Clostridiales bacterium]|nr:hypothetical protein [Clostridiales bacterium]MDN5282136.1 hypothetical protein [Candidatus Ozemobacter sp.]